MTLEEQNQDYKPRTREVLAELCRGAGSSAVNFTKGTAKGFALALLIPYILPSIVRAGVKQQEKEEEEAKAGIKQPMPVLKTCSEETGMLTGVIASVGTQIGYYYVCCTHEHNEALLIPVATNVISGVAELGFYAGNRAYKSAERRLINNQKAKVLNRFSDKC